MEEKPKRTRYPRKKSKRTRYSWSQCVESVEEKSPCRDCSLHKKCFPKCMKNCKKIAAFQEKRIDMQTFSNYLPESEPYSICRILK